MIGRRSPATGAAPEVSVVVVVYDIPREAPRTLRSLSASYQRYIPADAYEVIVVDNGSTPPFDRGVLEGLHGHFHLIRIDDAAVSPARAINRGLAAARGQVIGVMIDGARLVTPGLLHFARHGARMFERAVVATLGWHLGFDTTQALAMEAGYDERREDGLLASIDWPTDGYRLFEIGAFDGSSIHGWLGPAGESNALFLPRPTWDALGGVDERFDAPGGGLLNLDTFRRAAEMPNAHLVVLLGEATFHQRHGGIATGADPQTFRARVTRWVEQYAAIRERPWKPPAIQAPRTFLGHLPRPALAHFVRTALEPIGLPTDDGDTPLGSAFDRGLWSLQASPRPVDPGVARLMELAEGEFRSGRYAAAAAVARLARGEAPDEPAPQRLLAHASAWAVRGEPPADQKPAMHVALGEAYRLLGRDDQARAEYRAALALDGDLPAAHLGVARLNMPGPIPLPPQGFIDAVGGADFLAMGREIFGHVQRRCGLKPTDRILDIGSGCGRLAVPLTQYLGPEGEYDGLDVVWPMVEWCRRNISAPFPRFRFHHASLRNSRYSDTGADAKDYTFPFEDGRFDLVVAASLFTHLLPASAARYAAETARVLRDGGRAFLSFFLRTEDYDERAQIKAPHRHPAYSVADEDNPEAVVALDERYVLSTLREAGLSVDDVSYGSWNNHGGGGLQDVIVASKGRPHA